jgi:ribosomal-protein-alanine N-acetyltransferase
MKKFKALNTERLVLRRLNDSDIPNLFIMRSDQETNQYVDVRLDISYEDTKVYIDKMNKGIDENEWLIWGIELNHELIGSISLWNFSDDEKEAELGYGLAKKYFHQGYMSEALSKVIDYGFNELNLDRIFAFTSIDNEPSKKLLSKKGFSHVDTITEPGYFQSKVFIMFKYKIENKNS